MIRIPVAAGVMLLLALAPRPAGAQQRAPRPEGWPDASTVVRQFLEGRNGVAITAAIVRCPQQNPYGDTAWTVLLGSPPTPSLVARLAPVWAAPLRTCGDSRLASWYQQRLRESTTLTGALPVLAGLTELRTPQNVEFLKQIAFDDARDAELRSEILRRLGDASSWPARLDIYLEAFVRSRRMPEPFAYNAFYELAGSPVADRLVERALAAVEEHPRNGNAERVLTYLATDPRLRQRPELRARVRTALVGIEANQDGRFPGDLVAAARARRVEMDRRPAPRQQAVPASGRVP